MIRNIFGHRSSGGCLSGKVSKPTESEVGILQVLWMLGSGTVRQVHDQLGGGTGYTSTLKLMQIMYDKGLLKRTPQGRLHIYQPAQAEARTQRHLARDLIDRAFGGSARKLIVAALDSRRATPQELTEIRKLLDEIQQGNGQ